MIKFVSDLRQTGRWFSGVSSTNKTDRHDITEILLKVVLNSIKQTNKQYNTIKRGTYKMRNETRNEIYRNETTRNEIHRNETKSMRNEINRNEIDRSETKRYNTK